MFPDLEQIQKAHDKISPWIHKTPVLCSSSLNNLCGAELYFKCENFQKAGSFKIRGATNALLCLSDEQKKNGVATHSSGNHAQAIALAAKNNEVNAYIVMPENSSKVKIDAVKGYGAEIIFCLPNIESRQLMLDEVVSKTGAAFIHPYNDFNVIAGQATAAKELIEEKPELDYILVPVGGGGLISGTALAAHYLSPGTVVIGAEPKAVDDASLSLKSGTLQKNAALRVVTRRVKTANTIADGLMTNLGDKPFDIICRYMDDIITVTEEEIISGMQMIWERMKIIIEPSSAVAVAALFKGKNTFNGKKVGVILTGGNVDLSRLPF